MDRLYLFLQNFSDAGDPCTLTKGAGGLFLPTWYKYLAGEQDHTGRCIVDANMPDDIGRILLAIVDILLRLGGLVAVIFVMYGGYKYITSQGEPEQTKSARQTITNALIGLMLCVTAIAIVAFVGQELTTPETP
jgi:TRAP-type C4-dicarboxylate transport system permease small subunit